MKIPFLTTALALTSLVTRAVADVTLGPFPDVVDAGSTYTLSWTATQNYTYTLWLVVETEGEGGYGWSKAQGLATSLEFNHLQGSYTFKVPGNLTSHNSYSLWLDGFAIPFNGSSYASMTDWFKVSYSSLNPSNTTGTSTSATPSSSSGSSTSHTASTSTFTGTPLHTSSFPTSTSAPSTSHTSSHLSGGAIAGIVIGLLIGIAGIVAAVLFGKWRSKRTALQKREAAARDSRLAPVMQAGAGSFEMNGRNKDLAV